MAFGLKGQIHITLNPLLMFFLDKAISNALSTHVASVALFGSF
jgi:hypothetical protein